MLFLLSFVAHSCSLLVYLLILCIIVIFTLLLRLLPLLLAHIYILFTLVCSIVYLDGVAQMTPVLNPKSTVFKSWHTERRVVSVIGPNLVY